MGTFEQPKTPVKPATQAAQKTTRATSPRTAMSDAIADTARDVVSSEFLGNRPYLKMAFSNPYNLSLFFGALAAAGVTLNPLLALAALGLEALWLLHAPESTRLRHILWDPRFARIKEAMDAQERANKLRGVAPEERQRVDSLVARQRDIRTLASRNPSFTGDLLRSELTKTDRLVTAFVGMTVTCSRYHEYLESIDLDQLERDRRRYEGEARNGAKDDPQTELARKNLAILLKRLDKMKEIRRFLTTAKGQLDLIENSFQLIEDQIVTMQSPAELSGQLDELLDGVEAIKETTRDTERILNSVGGEV